MKLMMSLRFKRNSVGRQWVQC